MVVIRKNILWISIMLISVLMFGCSNTQVSKEDTKEIQTVDIDDAILKDTKIVYENLQDAMDRTVQYGSTSDVGVLSNQQYDEKISFYLDEDHYSGFLVNNEQYSDDEYELIELTSNATTSYLEYVKSVLIGDTDAKEQVLESFNRDMDSINTIINKAR
jgi:hypothetical protein